MMCMDFKVKPYQETLQAMYAKVETIVRGSVAAD